MTECEQTCAIFTKLERIQAVTSAIEIYMDGPPSALDTAKVLIDLARAIGIEIDCEFDKIEKAILQSEKK